jgi:methyl coenzyme M reductase beta subunit
MKKILILFAVILSSCKQTSVEEGQVPMFDSIVAEESSIDISMIDTASIDSVAEKITDLLISTAHADTKVKEIKDIKKENVSLKKELVETKAELQEVKTILADTLEPVKKKKSFIQKVISTIKKDTAQ